MSDEHPQAWKSWMFFLIQSQLESPYNGKERSQILEVAEQRRHSRLFFPWYCQINQPANCRIQPWYIFYPRTRLCLNNLMIINMINEWEVLYYIIYIKLLFKKLKNAVFLTLPIVCSLKYSNVKVAKLAWWLNNKLKVIT